MTKKRRPSTQDTELVGRRSWPVAREPIDDADVTAAFAFALADALFLAESVTLLPSR